MADTTEVNEEIEQKGVIAEVIGATVTNEVEVEVAVAVAAVAKDMRVVHHHLTIEAMIDVRVVGDTNAHVPVLTLRVSKV